MRTTQEIFNLLIEHEFYILREGEAVDYMCVSLLQAYNVDLISQGEYQGAVDEIDDYLDQISPNGSGCLSDALNSLTGIYIYSNVNMAIYKDWENRPMDANAALDLIEELDL